MSIRIEQRTDAHWKVYNEAEWGAYFPSIRLYHNEDEPTIIELHGFENVSLRTLDLEMLISALIQIRTLYMKGGSIQAEAASRAEAQPAGDFFS